MIKLGRFFSPIHLSVKDQFSDIELVTAITQDDVMAFEEIYSRYSKGMFLYAMNIFKKKEVCEDIVQNVFVDFWSKRKSATVTNVKAYLFQAVKFQVFNQMRNQKMSSEDLTRLNIIDVSVNVSQTLEFHELEDLIDNQVEKLPPRCQEIFVLSRYEHKSNKEIATELGISTQAVKNQISKALDILRQSLSSEEVAFFFLLFHDRKN